MYDSIKKFAILCRVSTEIQMAKGESLSEQKRKTLEYVEMLGGVLVAEYVGQEHTYNDSEERVMLNRLKQDADNKKFDCICVTNLDRFGRNDDFRRELYKVFKKNNIEIYCGMRKYDLNSPDDAYYLGLDSLNSQFYVERLQVASRYSRKKRAERNFPTGRHPFGRNLVNSKNRKNADAIWEVDEEKRNYVLELYNLYIGENKSFSEIASVMTSRTGKRHHATQVRRILVNYSCDTWVAKMKDGDVEIKIPSLLNEEQIYWIKTKAYYNRCIRNNKVFYALSGKIKCAICGKKLTVQSTIIDEKVVRKYRHSSKSTSQCNLGLIDAEKIEIETALALSIMLSSSENLKAAINHAIQNSETKIKAITFEIEKMTKELDQNKKSINNLIFAIEKNENENKHSLTSIFERLRELEKRNNFLESEINLKNTELKPLQINITKDIHKKIFIYLMLFTNQYGVNLADWPIDQLSKVLQFFFGKNENNGVFVTKVNDTYHCELKGALGIYNLDFNEYDEFEQILKKIIIEMEPSKIQLSKDATIDQFYELITQVKVNNLIDGMSEDTKRRIISAYENTYLCG